MYTPQIEPVSTITLPEPKVNFLILRAFRSIMRPFARFLKFAEPQILFPERMVDQWHDFNQGKTRLLLGFRHAYGDDPQLMVYTIHKSLPKYARKIQRPLRALSHVHFVYGTEVPLWSGKFVRWVLPKGGALPVNHVRMDSVGMGRIRKTLLNGDFPIALAPEGHVTHSSETVEDLETGTARFCFWCLEDLAKQNRNEKMIFLPISLHYRYHEKSRYTLSNMIAQMEKECALETRLQTSRKDLQIPQRLQRLGSKIIALLADFYATEDHSGPEAQASILEASLCACERMYSLPHDGTPAMRIYRVRSSAWDRLFRSDLNTLSPLEKELAGRQSGEAWYAMRHLETSGILYQVNLTEIPETASLEHYIEIANNFYDLMERLKGGTLRNRPNFFKKYPIIIPGKPVVMNDFLDLYRKNKKAAFEEATALFRERYLDCIAEYRNIFPL